MFRQILATSCLNLANVWLATFTRLSIIPIRAITFHIKHNPHNLYIKWNWVRSWTRTMIRSFIPRLWNGKWNWFRDIIYTWKVNGILLQHVSLYKQPLGFSATGTYKQPDILSPFSLWAGTVIAKCHNSDTHMLRHVNCLISNLLYL